MITRTLGPILSEKARLFPIVSVTGPRQSGKTTLCKQVFSEYIYYNLEAPETFQMIMSNPRGFLSGKSGVVLDEIQKAPELFSYLQVISDEQEKPGQFIISGSQNFLLQDRISQTLAGRVYNARLLPPDLIEIANSLTLQVNPDYYMFRGFYPRVIAQELPPSDFYPQYIQTYVERDVRDVLRIGNLALFQRFMRVLAGRAGKLINLSEIGNQVGVDHKTIRSWISILEASYLVFFLQPFERNFNKRIIKTPKIYFYDTGILCSLLNIQNEESLMQHWARGEVFENLVIANYQKCNLHQGIYRQLYFWRDQSGNEIDCIYESDGKIHATEIKSAASFSTEFLKHLKYFRKLSNDTDVKLSLVYGGNENWETADGIEIKSWKRL